MVTVPENINTKRLDLTQQSETQHLDPDTFYQTIIDNNIFRPLNWEPLHREPDYRLLGTIIATDGHQATAYIQDLKSETLNTVSENTKQQPKGFKTIVGSRDFTEYSVTHFPYTRGSRYSRRTVLFKRCLCLLYASANYQ